MGENSKIEWTDHTFNPWIGCTKVSPGCDNCYAKTLMEDRWHKVKWGNGEPRVLTSNSNWREPILWNERAQKAGVRERVFCASLADVFDSEVPVAWRQELFEVIRATPMLDWLLLTKRPQLAKPYVDFFYERPNTWLGVSVEDQDMLELRVPVAVAISPRVFLSMEPLLGPCNLARISESLSPNIKWVIVGGESGIGHRPMQASWARSIADQCNYLRKPFFMKQMAGKKTIPPDLLIRQTPWETTP